MMVMETAILTYDSDAKIYVAPDGSTWKAIKNAQGKITGYIEVFKTHALLYCTVPGASRFIRIEK